MNIARHRWIWTAPLASQPWGERLAGQTVLGSASPRIGACLYPHLFDARNRRFESSGSATATYQSPRQCWARPDGLAIRPTGQAADSRRAEWYSAWPSKPSKGDDKSNVPSSSLRHVGKGKKRIWGRGANGRNAAPLLPNPEGGLFPYLFGGRKRHFVSSGSAAATYHSPRQRWARPDGLAIRPTGQAADSRRAEWYSAWPSKPSKGAAEYPFQVESQKDVKAVSHG